MCARLMVIPHDMGSRSCLSRIHNDQCPGNEPSANVAALRNHTETPDIGLVKIVPGAYIHTYSSLVVANTGLAFATEVLSEKSRWLSVT